MTIETMSVGDINRRLGDVPVTEKVLAKLGFEAVGRDKRAVLYAQADYPAMCKAVAKYVADKAGVPMQPRPPKEEKAPAAAKAGASKPAATSSAAAKPFDEEDEEDEDDL